jgi:ankyrin repeat protein
MSPIEDSLLRSIVVGCVFLAHVLSTEAQPVVAPQCAARISQAKEKCSSSAQDEAVRICFNREMGSGCGDVAMAVHRNGPVDMAQVAVCSGLLRARRPNCSVDVNNAMFQCVAASVGSDCEEHYRSTHDLENMTLLTAASSGSVDDIRIAISAGADLRMVGSDALRRAAAAQSAAKVTTLLGAGAKLQEIGRDGTPLLFGALARGKAQEVKLLLVAGASPNPKVEPFKNGIGSRNTLLAAAIEEGQDEIVEELIGGGADVNMPTWDHEYPLTLAIMHWESATSRKLLLAGADPNVTAHGQSPLHLAASHGDLEMVRALLSAGAKPELTDGRGQRPLDVVPRDNPDVVQLLKDVTPGSR